MHAEAPSGRQLSWGVLESIVAVLFPSGCRVQLRDGDGGAPPSPRRKQQRVLNSAAWRAHMASLAAKQTPAMRSRARMKIPRRRRKEIARMAAQARWNKVRRARQRLARMPASERQSIVQKMSDFASPLA